MNRFFECRAYRFLFTAMFLSLAACDAILPSSDSKLPAKNDEVHDDQDGHDHEEMESPALGIAIPSSVRDNLGITFAKVERRGVAATRRLPGAFELLPTARQEYRALLPGRIELHVTQFQRVEVGTPLFSVDSPQWRQIQHEAVEAEGEIIMAKAALDVARAQRDEVGATLAKQNERIQSLGQANARSATLEVEVNTLRSSLPRLDAETRAREAALREAHEHYDSRLKVLSSVTGISIDSLSARNGEDAAWRSIEALVVRSQQAGVIESLLVNQGGWLEEGELAMTTVAPEQVRFHAKAPQGDLGYFREGQSVTMVPAQVGGGDERTAMHGTLTMGLTVNEEDRTLSLYASPVDVAPWAKAGVAGYLEVAVDEAAPTALAIPVAAVIQDGLEQVFYRRSPKDPDRALRAVADLGESDGRWVVVKSGVKEGDEVVLDGVYSLKLTGDTQQTPDGYHYHADGSLHKDH